MSDLISRRATDIDASGIRRVFDLGAQLKSPINLSIGQPDFDVPEPIKQAAIDAIRAGRNGYTVTQGIADLRARLTKTVADEFGWDFEGPNPEHSLFITSGVSGGLLLAMLALIDPGDEVIIADPCFVLYQHVIRMAEGRPVFCDTYPDFRLTAERIEAMITERTKIVLINSPSNPTGVVNTQAELDQIVELCQSKGIMLISDEIYDVFTYAEHRVNGTAPSAAAKGRNILLMKGFSKTYAMTGWRMGYVAGPAAIINEMTKLQQYTYVCAPSMAQAACVTALDVDMSDFVTAYQRKRDMVVQRLSEVTELVVPGGAFYAFPKVPDALGCPAGRFVEDAVSKNVLIIPGSVFSQRDTHFRLSYATDDAVLSKGLDILCKLMTP
ncbi:MAG: aminotransferase class I/II-fold pyridoxal phosphate-dependent enzyme [Phycisphaerales bacterium]|nr:aminotransferase class I/II-fold pyridoxal phosphate-dependent enzyme [Phycisphaerales bacterium]